MKTHKITKNGKIKKSGLSYYSAIKWCLDHRLIKSDSNGNPQLEDGVEIVEMVYPKTDTNLQKCIGG